jgi:hypothetical protein
VDANATETFDQFLLGCDLVLGDQRKNRFLPLTL